MTCRPFPRRFHAAVASFAVVAAAYGLPAKLQAQDPAPGTPDETFVMDRVRNNSFIPALTNFTPFVIAVQPGRDPVNFNTPSVREVPAGQSKLIIAGDGATLYRAFLTQTVRAATNYDADGVPVTTFTSPFQPGDIDPVFFASPAVTNGFGNGNRTTFALSVNADGSLLAGGLFGPTALESSVYDGNEKNFILLNFNGDAEIFVDADGKVFQGPFNSNLRKGANSSVLAILRRTSIVPGESDGRILIGGEFTRFAKEDRGHVLQLLPDGTRDVDFNRNLGDGANGVVYSLAEAVGPGVNAAGVGFFGVNGQTYVCGDFDKFDGDGPGKLVRLNADGTRDVTFTPDIKGRAIAIAVQPDGQIVLGGDLNSVNGTEVNNLCRLNYDGTLDPVFLANARASLSSPNNIPPTSVYVLRVQGDGRILVGGNYLRLDGVGRRYLGRLNADGTLDASFDSGDTLNQANQSVVYVPRDASLGNATDLIYSQTRADRKQVPGDNGFYPAPVRRLFGDNNGPGVTSFPLGAPLVRIGADGPTATVGDLSVQPDLAGQVVSDPGSPGLFRITREGDTSTDLTVRLKVVQPSAAADLNVTYALRLLLFTRDATTGIVNTTVTDRFDGPRFDLVIPAGERGISVLVEGLADGRAQFNGEPVTLKLKASADGSYGLRADQRAATVTILPNNL